MSRRSRTLVLALLVLAAGALNAAAEEDRAALEASLFTESAGNTVPAGEPLPIPVPSPEISTVGFSGKLTSAFVDQVGNSSAGDALATLTVASIYLDARLPQMAKVFADLEATYLSQRQTTLVALRELFLDFNWNYRAYFRTGKQVLQWGRCALWNPTDVINVERQHFVRILGNREGAYGMKVHVPFGTWLNLYDFVDTGSAAEAGAVANAAKVEFLIGDFEAAFSAWAKRGFRPIWGFDLSTRLFGVDLGGELSVSDGDTQDRAWVRDGALIMDRRDARTAKAALNLSRSFTPGDFKDQLTVMVEGYYDAGGYDRNELADGTVRPFAESVFTPGAPLIASGTLGEFLSHSNLYQPNYLSKAYAAMFVAFTRFLLSDLTLNANYIHNVIDTSGLVSAGLTYTALNTFTAGFLANVRLGAADQEFRYFGGKYDLQLTLGIAF